MSSTDTTTSPRSVSTNDWDTVYALYFPDVNQAIVAQKSSPKSLSYSGSDDDGPYSLAGTFGDWQLVTGGDGENLHLQVPVTAATLTLPGTPATDDAAATEPKTTTLSLVLVTIEVKLGWVNAAQDANTLNLTVSTASPAPTQPAVAIVNVDYGANTLNLPQRGIFTQSVEQCLLGNAGAFKHVFSSISLNASLDTKPGFQWTVPTATLYAVVDQEDATDTQDFARSIFAVLCMTEGRPSPGAHQVDPFAIPVGDGTKTVNSAFLISPARILENMILPGLSLMFRGNPPTSSFSLTAGGLVLTNNVELQFTDQQLDNGNTVNPTVSAQNFSISMMGPLIEVKMTDLHFDYVSGTTVHIDHTSTVSLVLNSAGQFKMDLTNSTNHATVTQSDAVYIASIATTIGLALATAAVGGLLGGVAAPVTDVLPIAVGEAGDEIGAGAIEMAPVVLEDAADGAAAAANDVGNVGGDDVMAAVTAAANGAPSKFSVFFASFWGKALVVLTKALVGGSVAIVNFAVKYAALKNDGEIPTLDAFGTQVMAPITWPNLKMPAAGGTLGDQLVSGKLNGAFQVGLNLEFDHTPAATPAA